MDTALAVWLALAAALLLLLHLFSVALYYFKRRHDPITDVEQQQQSSPDVKISPIRRFASSEMDAITASFTPSNIIGHGGFSTVYSATLPSSNNTSVAVKVHHSSDRLRLAFRQELDVLLRVTHPRIVRLLGYCNDADRDGVLVFEHVPNGTLHDALHLRGASPPPLSWSQRTNIAVRLAVALRYLHDECDPGIVHGDIKTSNVLLDSELSPKLCDFGSARMGFSASVAQCGAKNQMMGSPGYVDPHYVRTGIVSKKSDVYSFGVMILELITGMEAYCSEKELLLTAMMRPVLVSENIGKRLREVADSKLGNQYDEDEMLVMVDIAAMCVSEHPVHRPAMADVLRIMRDKIPSSDVAEIDRQKSENNV